MKRLERIIVPTDLHEPSRRAIELAATFAADNHGELLILHIANGISAWQQLDDELGFAPPWTVDRVIKEGLHDLDRFLEGHGMLLKRVPRVLRQVKLGPIPDLILATAGSHRADLIVLAPRSRRSIRSLMGMGITEKLTRNSPCPVLCAAPPAPSRQWRGKRLPAALGWWQPQHEGI